MFVLRAHTHPWDHTSDGFYTGKSYVYQAARYAVVDNHIANAKRYSKRHLADRAAKTDFENYTFEVEEIDDGK